jgi:Tol biopolymer transport system component
VNRVLRIDVNASTTSTVLEYGNGIERRGTDNLALSPDGKWVALGWLNTPDRTLRIAILPSDQPFPTRLVEHAVVTYQLPADPSRLEWIDTLAWSPDGRQLAFALGAIDSAPEAERPLTTLQLLDVQAGTVHELARPAQGYYAGGPMWWSTDGTAVFKQWWGCYGCDGAPTGIDVADAASGKVVRTIEQAAWLGTLDGARQLIATPQQLFAVRSLEPPRALILETQSAHASYVVAPSPDGNWLALTESFNSVDAVAAVAADGTSQAVLGTLPPGPGIEAMRDLQTVLTLGVGGLWTWSSLVDRSTQPLPHPEAPVPTDKAAPGFSSDARHLAYWSPTSTQGQLQLYVLDLATDEARALDVFTDEAAGMHLAMSPDGRRVAYFDGDELVVVDAATEQSQRFAVADVGYDPLAGHSSAFEFASADAIDIVSGEALQRLDLTSGAVSVNGAPPLPGGWRGNVTLSRSPDGKHLVAVTAFGVFIQQAGGSWRQVGSGGAFGAEPVRFAWSPDSSRFAYTGSGSAGLVVASVDGSEAYELVRGESGRPIGVLGWLPDGRIVYAVRAQGL